jgi:hypothetical protein
MTVCTRAPARWGARAFCLALAGLGLAACATAVRVPPPDVAAHARDATSYSATVRVDLRGPDIRGRARVFVGLERPDALRIELPGPTGPRLLAVARGDVLVAVFPGDRAVFTSPATAAEMESLLGVALTPGELFDLLVGRSPARLLRYEALWGASLPREVRAAFPGGARLTARIEDAEMNPSFGPGVFEPPAHAGFRVVDAQEARNLWLR